MKRLTSEWVQKAEEDYRVAEQLLSSPTAVFEAVCFHAQQCAEKYLKAWLAEQDLRIPRTHDLDLLGQLTSPTAPDVAALASDLSRLAAFAVEVRYPGASATAADAHWSVSVAQAVRRVIQKQLG